MNDFITSTMPHKLTQSDWMSTTTHHPRANLLFSYYDIWRHPTSHKRRHTMCSWRCMYFWLISSNERINQAWNQLISPRSSPHYQSKALQKLEYFLALACCASGIKGSSEDDKDSFFALQYTFECNGKVLVVAQLCCMLTAVSYLLIQFLPKCYRGLHWRRWD
jgi:hypothetical protein